jgi:hypothetical protein
MSEICILFACEEEMADKTRVRLVTLITLWSGVWSCVVMATIYLDYASDHKLEVRTTSLEQSAAEKHLIADRSATLEQSVIELESLVASLANTIASKSSELFENIAKL